MVIWPLASEFFYAILRGVSMIMDCDENTKPLFWLVYCNVVQLTGRFIVTSSTSLNLSILTTILVGMQEIIFRVTHTSRDRFYVRVIKMFRRGRAIIDAQAHLEKQNTFFKKQLVQKCNLLITEMIGEYVSILISPIFLIFFYDAQASYAVTLATPNIPKILFSTAGLKSTY